MWRSGRCVLWWGTTIDLTLKCRVLSADVGLFVRCTRTQQGPHLLRKLHLQLGQGSNMDSGFIENTVLCYLKDGIGHVLAILAVT